MLKKVFLFLLFIPLSLMSFGQTLKDGTKIPESVSRRFTTLFPEITNGEWENCYYSDSVNYKYMMVFMLNNQNCWVCFDSTGLNAMTTMELLYDSLPVSTKGYLSKKYKRHIANDSYYKLPVKKRRYYNCVVFHERVNIDQKGNKLFSLVISKQRFFNLPGEEEKLFLLHFDSYGKFIDRKRVHIYM